MQDNEVELYLHDLWRSLTNAGMSCRVWRVLMEGTMEAKFGQSRAQEWVGAINSYPGFFEPTMRACMMHMIIGLHNVFHGVERTVNLPRISEQLRKHEHIADESLDKVREVLANTLDSRKKIAKLRNKAIAHRDKKQIGKDLFSEHKLTAEEVEELFSTGHQLLNLLSSESINHTYSANIEFVEQHTNALMETLIAKDRLVTASTVFIPPRHSTPATGNYLRKAVRSVKNIYRGTTRWLFGYD